MQNILYNSLQTQDTCSQPGGAWVYELRISSFVFLNEYYVASFQTWQKCYSKREIESGVLETDEKIATKSLLRWDISVLN